MRRLACATLAAPVLAAAMALTAGAETIAPGEVTFEDGAVSTSLTGKPGDPAEGKTIITTKKMGNCVSCHAAEALKDTPWLGEVGPVLDGAGSRWSEAELRGIVANAKMKFEGSMMPSFYKVDGFIRPGDAYTGKAAKTVEPILTAQQIEDVVAYLKTLKE